MVKNETCVVARYDGATATRIATHMADEHLFSKPMHKLPQIKVQRRILKHHLY